MGTEDKDAADVTSAEESRIRDVYARRRLAVTVGRYSLLHRPNLYRIQQVERVLVRELARPGSTPLAECRILDVGCGAGFWLREFARWGATPSRLHGVDLLDDRIADARRLSPADMAFDSGSAAALQFPDGTFDFVTQFTMFTSILDDDLRHRIASEMRRVLKVGGRILWFDFHFDNPNNSSVRRVTRSEIGALFPDCAVRFMRVGLVPPLANRLGKVPLVYELLCGIPWLCTHHVAVITPLAPSVERPTSPR